MPTWWPFNRTRSSLLKRHPFLLVVLAVAVIPLTAIDRSPVARGQEPAVLLVAGDISNCPRPSTEATARLLDQHPGTIAIPGDLVYAPGDWENCYHPTWGRHKDRSKPVPGDGDYEAGIELYDAYWAEFGPALGTPGNRWYSYDLGGWHVIAMDSTCFVEPDLPGCDPQMNTRQLEWLKADLAAHPSACTAVYWQHVFWDRGRTRASMRPVTQVLYDHGVDLLLTGHRHTYRRHAPFNVAGEPDPTYGIRELVAGTGGARLNETESPNQVLEVAHGDTFGLLKLKLSPTSYEWEFLPVEGSTFTDSGSTNCHGKPDGSPMPPPRPTASTIHSTTSTTTSGPPAQPTTTTTVPAAATARSGYWMLGADGAVFAFGDAGHHGNAGNMTPGVRTVDLEPDPSGNGYWLLESTGKIHARGSARHFGDASGALLAADETVTSMSATPSGRGYWLFTDRGRALVFGDAPFLGDMSAVTLNGPVLDSIPTPTGRGYYMVASDGGIFAFGDAQFRGSMGDQTLNAPVQSLVPTLDGQGYWLVASDGGVFAFDAPFRGSMGGTRLNEPITGMVPFGNGYLMVGADGGIFNFSDRPFHGSLGDSPPSSPVVAVAAIES